MCCDIFEKFWDSNFIDLNIFLAHYQSELRKEDQTKFIKYLIIHNMSFFIFALFYHFHYLVLSKLYNCIILRPLTRPTENKLNDHFKTEYESREPNVCNELPLTAD